MPSVAAPPQRAIKSHRPHIKHADWPAFRLPICSVVQREGNSSQGSHERADRRFYLIEIWEKGRYIIYFLFHIWPKMKRSLRGGSGVMEGERLLGSGALPNTCSKPARYWLRGAFRAAPSPPPPPFMWIPR